MPEEDALKPNVKSHEKSSSPAEISIREISVKEMVCSAVQPKSSVRFIV